MLTVDDLWVITLNAKGDTSPASNKLNAMLIREYGDEARTVILEYRKAYRKSHELSADEWKVSVSRRAIRGNHHDSWAIREGYVRNGRSGYSAYYKLGHDLIREAIENGARNRIPEAEQNYIR